MVVFLAPTNTTPLIPILTIIASAQGSVTTSKAVLPRKTGSEQFQGQFTQRNRIIDPVAGKTDRAAFLLQKFPLARFALQQNPPPGIVTPFGLLAIPPH